MKLVRKLLPFLKRRQRQRTSDFGTKNVLILLFICMLWSVIHFQLVGLDDFFHMCTYNTYNEPCILPHLDPFDPSVMKRVIKLAPIDCSGTSVVFIDKYNVLQFNMNLVQELHIDPDKIVCDCQNVTREQNDESVTFSSPFSCRPPYDHNSDFLKITCSDEKRVLTDTILTKIHREKQFGELTDGHFNVLLFGIDSVSRSTSIRQMPHTLKYLKQNLGAFDFSGHMTIEDGTYCNLMAILSGLLPAELPSVSERQPFVDIYPFIWKNFSRKQYVTMFAEDAPSIGTFNLGVLKGFTKPPVNHYMRPYWLAWNKMYPHRGQTILGGLTRQFVNVGVLKVLTEQISMCAGHIPNYVAHINYVRQFFNTYKGERKFALPFLTEIGHDNPNILNIADSEIMTLFKDLDTEGHLDNTFLILFSDHGPRTGDGDTLPLKRLEKSLPMLYIVPPKKFRAIYPEIMKSLDLNSRRLTTHFDLHATLRDILHMNFRNPGQFQIGGSVRGYSLFREVPRTRSCAEAKVPEHTCVCYKMKNITVEATNSELIHRMAEEIVRKINSFYTHKADCAALSLNKVIDVQEATVSGKQDKQRTATFVIRPRVQMDQSHKYTVAIETVPGKGHFYATCIVNNGDRSIEVLDNIDRINRYNNQSYCVKERRLKLYCFCKMQ